MSGYVLLESGYCDCACSTCFEIAIGSAGDVDPMCWECEQAGCDGGECQCEPEGFDDEEDGGAS